MKIVLLGNIGTGKTTIAEIIKDKWGKAELLSIDNIRKKYGDGSTEKENFCKKKFIDTVKSDDSFQIIELSGVGVLGEKLFSLLKNYKYPILVIYLFVPESTLNERIKNRTWDTPFPLKIDKVQDAMFHTNRLYKEGLLDTLMNLCKSAFYLSLENSESRLKINSNFIENTIKFLLKK